MSTRLTFVCGVVVLALALPLRAADEMVGTWSGTYTFTSRSDCPLTESNSASAAFNQNAAAVTGYITLVDVAWDTTSPPGCTITSRKTFTVVVSGSVSGSSFTGTATIPLLGATVPLTGSVSGDLLGAGFTAGTETFIFTLTRTSSMPPSTQFSGDYSGGFSAAISPCCKAAAVPYSGSVALKLEQTGSVVTGTANITGFKSDRANQDGSCTIVDDPPVTVAFTGQVSGNTITGFFFPPGDDPTPFTATVSGNTLTGSTPFECAGEFFNFSLTRSPTTPPNPPLISSFSASPATINVGESSTLSWTTNQAFSVTIDNGLGAQSANGSVRVSPTQTTTYALTAEGNQGPATARTTVTVAAPVPRVVVSSTPRGMVQLTGVGGGTDAFTLTNIGTLQTTVALAKTGDFFAIAPQSVTLGPRESATIAITGLPQPVGSFDGTVTTSGAGANGLGVRVRLLSAGQPAGTVAGRPTQSRAEINAPAGQSATGSVGFTNTGNATLQGIAVADAPWITPQSGVISIGPGQTTQVSFTVDFAKRPDADAPLGAVTGSLSLVFLRGSGGTTASDNAPGTSQVSVTLVYVVKPGTSPGTPPPLAGNEIALFVPGLSNRPNASGDFLLSNRLPTGSLSDVKLYLLAPGAPTQQASLPSLPAGASALFPSLLKNVFAASAQTGTAQVRTADTTKISVAAIQTNTSSPAGTFSTSLPLLRSDRGVSNGAAVVLSGVAKETGQQTNIYVQELSGVATTVQIQSLDTNGGVIATRAAQSLEAFGLLEVLDATSAQTVSARVLNVGSGRIGAFALVTSTVNGDAWIVTDPGVDTAVDGTMFIPLFSAGTAAQTVLYATNRSASAISATIDVRAGNRQRAVRKTATGGSGFVSIPHALSNVNLSAQQTFVGAISSASAGYIRITAPAGVLSAVGRTLRADPGQPAYGSGLPAIAASSALAAGESKRFAGVDDASPANRAAKAPATFHSNLMLIETANAASVVRVTFSYTFAVGTTVSARAVSTREYTVSASQFVFIPDVISDVIGSQRATFGDLRNIDIDVEVVSGGRIIPVLQSIDNGSDDSVVRLD